MKTIKFDHKYDKMPADFSVSRLLEVFVVDRDDLHEGFLCYDTTHGTEGDMYPLPKGKLIVLLLQTMDDKLLWTTVRRCTTSKLKQYSSIRGSFVNCKVML